MNIKSDCLVCLLNQSLRVSKHLKLNEDQSQELLRQASEAIATYADVPPPVAASDLYPRLSNLLKREDLYAKLKAKSTQEAFKLLPIVRDAIEQESSRISIAIKAAVAGNVIDFATPNQFDLVEEFDKIFQSDFALDEEEDFLVKLSRAKEFMIIGDNVGEHLFDKLLLEEIAKLYPDLKLYYAVRGVPIINDVTLKEAQEIGMEEVAKVVDSGVNTPGLVYEVASSDFMALYQRMDLILAKGMGNYECLEGVGDLRIYHLFKVKCEVVATTVGARLGSLVFKNNLT
jgi:uncharacterized protein with ATP-grasp and redox domains